MTAEATQAEPEDPAETVEDQTVETAYGVPATESLGTVVLHPSPSELIDTVAALRDDGFDMAIDVCGVDYSDHPGRDLPPGIDAERFEVVVNLISHAERDRIRLRVQVPEADPIVPTLFDLYPGVEAMEREAYDMFGIVFTDHPDMSRILMPEDWEGHPLRKDFSVGRIPVQFKGSADGLEPTSAGS